MEQRKHENSIQKHRVKRRQCPQCPVMFSSSRSLLEHTLTQYPKNAVEKSPIETAAAISPPTTTYLSSHIQAASLVVTSKKSNISPSVSATPPSGKAIGSPNVTKTTISKTRDKTRRFDYRLRAHSKAIAFWLIFCVAATMSAGPESLFAAYWPE